MLVCVIILALGGPPIERERKRMKEKEREREDHMSLMIN